MDKQREMMKYRVIKSEQTNSLGENIKVNYFIQKKVLFWWVKARIKYGYTLGRYHGGSSDIMINNGYFILNSAEQANEFIDKYLTNPLNEYYKNCKIIRIMNEYSRKEVFVNKRRITEYYASKPCYEYSNTIAELKLKIDKRIINTTLTTQPTTQK